MKNKMTSHKTKFQPSSYSLLGGKQPSSVIEQNAQQASTPPTSDDHHSLDPTCRGTNSPSGSKDLALVHEITNIMKSTKEFAGHLLEETEKTIKKTTKALPSAFNPLENIQNIYSKSLVHIETMLGQLILKLVVSKSPLLQYVQKFYNHFQAFLTIICNIKIQLNFSTQGHNISVSLFDSSQIMKALNDLYELTLSSSNNIVSNNAYIKSLVQLTQDLFNKFYTFFTTNLKYIQSKYHIPIQTLLKSLSNIVQVFASYYLKASGVSPDVNAVFQEILGLLQSSDETQNMEDQEQLSQEEERQPLQEEERQPLQEEEEEEEEEKKNSD